MNVEMKSNVVERPTRLVSGRSGGGVGALLYERRMIRIDIDVVHLLGAVGAQDLPRQADRQPEGNVVEHAAVDELVGQHGAAAAGAAVTVTATIFGAVADHLRSEGDGKGAGGVDDVDDLIVAHHAGAPLGRQRQVLANLVIVLGELPEPQPRRSRVEA